MADLGLFIGGLSGLFILGIFTRRTSAAEALIGALSSGAILWSVIHYTQMHFFLYSAVGCMACCAIGYLVSRARPHSKPLGGLTVFDSSNQGH